MRFENIAIDKIVPNPSNPRGIVIQEEDDKLSLLMESIKKLGILVPLVVEPQGRHFLLVDGERRYWAAKRLNLTTVPAYITPRGLTDREVLLAMFHIHHNREQWEPIQQCRALQTTYEQIAKRKTIVAMADEDARIGAIALALHNETGIELRTARHRILFLRWPKDIKDALYAKPGKDYWYIVEIEDNIILPALKNYPEYFESVRPEDVRTFLYEKWKANSVSKAVQVREAAPIFAYHPRTKEERTKVLTIVRELVDDRKLSYEEARDDFYRQFPHAIKVESPSPRILLSQITMLTRQIRAFDPELFKSSKKRAKASRAAVLAAIEELSEVLETLKELVADDGR